MSPDTLAQAVDTVAVLDVMGGTVLQQVGPTWHVTTYGAAVVVLLFMLLWLVVPSSMTLHHRGKG